MDAITVTRRGFVAGSGALFVSLQWRGALAGPATTGTEGSPDPAQLASWLEVRGDNSVLVRTGRTETGTGMSGYYTQVIAEELNVRPESVSLLMGDTDRTPDGGYSAGFIYGMSNVRKVAAYAYQALLGLAATQLGVPVSSLIVVDAVVHGGGKTITYGELVRGQHLDLKIPVTGRPALVDSTGWVGMTSLDGYSVGGDPPLKPMSQFKVIGTSFPVPGIPDKVTGKTRWSCDVRLPGMLHARMVRPPTLGSTLISCGKVDESLFPTARVIRKGNLIAAVSPDEWEAINAAQAVAAATKWTDWSGLPGSERLTQALRQHSWGQPETKGNAPAVVTALAGASRTITAAYEQAYVRHAPIGAFVAVADVRSNGDVTVWTHSAQSQGLRARLAHMLGMPVEKVIVRWLEHSGQYGRTTLGGDGAEADAVILSQLTGKPVRVQWTLQEDLAWSTASPGWVCDCSAGLDARGNLTALRTAFYSPHMFDPRPLGALLSGMPCSTSKPGGFIA
ncbi:MAG TPA: molybdopterin cofactor-binding domain-containing protein, partial [Steroidobacteraceae bacterium]